MDVSEALKKDILIDIATIGAKTGQRRVTEIWYTNIQGRIIITGTPSAEGSHGPRESRSWLANLKANPEFEFCLKESITQCLPARAVEVTNPEDRRRIMSAPETQWYRDQGFSMEDLVNDSPIVDVFFLGEYEYLNAKSR
jgi:hypothetical protein